MANLINYKLKVTRGHPSTITEFKLYTYDEEQWCSKIVGGRRPSQGGGKGQWWGGVVGDDCG